MAIQLLTVILESMSGVGLLHLWLSITSLDYASSDEGGSLFQVAERSPPTRGLANPSSP